MYIEKSISKNKAYCIQLEYWKICIDSLKINLNLFDHNNWFNLFIDLFGVIYLQIQFSKRTDHAGILFNLNALGLDFHCNIYDCRHWDSKINNWNSQN